MKMELVVVGSMLVAVSPLRALNLSCSCVQVNLKTRFYFHLYSFWPEDRRAVLVVGPWTTDG